MAGSVKIKTGSVKMKSLEIFWPTEIDIELLKQQGYVESPAFFLYNGEGEWYLRLTNDTMDGQVHVFIYPYERWLSWYKDDESFRIKISKIDGSSYIDENAVKYTTKADRLNGYMNPTPLTNLKSLLSNNFSVSVTYMDSHRIMIHSRDVSSQTISFEALNTLSKNFKELYLSAHQADVKMKVGDQNLQAHKSVLSARSPVFYSMFSQQMLENISGVVNIKDCDPDAFNSFLIFLYSGQLDQIPSSDIVDLYDIADKYDLPELKEECVKKLILELSLDSVCDALRLVSLHGEKRLMETATEFFLENAEQVLESSEWDSFHNESLKTELFKLYIKKSKKK